MMHKELTHFIRYLVTCGLLDVDPQNPHTWVIKGSEKTVEQIARDYLNFLEREARLSQAQEEEIVKRVAGEFGLQIGKIVSGPFFIRYPRSTPSVDNDCLIERVSQRIDELRQEALEKG